MDIMRCLLIFLGYLETNHDGTLNETISRDEFLAWLDNQYFSD